MNKIVKSLRRYILNIVKSACWLNIAPIHDFWCSDSFVQSRLFCNAGSRQTHLCLVAILPAADALDAISSRQESWCPSR